MKKSLGSTTPPPFRVFKIPGQVPGLRELQALTAMPSRRMRLVDSVHPCFTPQRVVEGLPLGRDWEQQIAKAMAAPNELVMRQDIFSRMHEERMDPGLRRELFARSLSLWREKGRMAKSVSVVTAGELRKADPRGGTYIKRVPKPGGGYRYFYNEDKYKAHSGAHVSGGEAAEAAITKAVAGHVKNAGKNGCELKALKSLAKRYGAELVGGMLNGAVADGSLVYKGKRLYARGAPQDRSPSQPSGVKGKEPATKTGKVASKLKLKPEKGGSKAEGKPEKIEKGLIFHNGRFIRTPGFYLTEPLTKAGPFIGPRGGKWADARHTIPWSMEHQADYEEKRAKEKIEKLNEHARETIMRVARRSGWQPTNKKGTRFETSGTVLSILKRGGKWWVESGPVGDPSEAPRGFYIGTVAHMLASPSGQRSSPAYAVAARMAGRWMERNPHTQTIPKGPDIKGAQADLDALRTGARIKVDENTYVKTTSSKTDISGLGRSIPTWKKTTGLPSRGFSQTVMAQLVADEGAEVLTKAGPHKYIRRIPKPGGGYRYFYAESAAAREAQAGEEIRLGKQLVKVTHVSPEGAVTIAWNGNQETVAPDQWHERLARHYGEAFVKGAEKRARQTINAVLRYVPRELLKDLKGETDEERLADLEKRVPQVYAKLRKAFSRAGMSPFAAKRSLGMVLERRGWEPEARAVALGTVIQHRDLGIREMIAASENLAGGHRVRAGHVAAAVELRAPGGKAGTFPEEISKLARSAESELAQLTKMLAAARGDPQKGAEVLARTMGSEAMQKLSMAAQAFPGLADRAIEPTRRAILAASSMVPRETTTTEGGETIVYVAGEGGRPKALKARYRLVEADTLIPSHDSESFARRKDYPEGVQERAYHRDKAEQAKVIRTAQKMDPRFVVNTNPDAVNGPPIVTPEGIVLGGNSRAMSMQRIYRQHPEKATEMRQYLESHAHEVGLTAGDTRAMKNPVLIREVKVEDKSKAGLQLLVRQMNESFTQGMDPRTMQVAMGRKLTDQTLQALADSMTEDETLAAFLASSRSERFVQSLFNAGIIDNRNLNQYMQKGTRKLNNDGRTLVSRILVGRTVDDADVLSDTGTQMLDSIAGSVPSMVQATLHGKGFDLGADLSVAIDAVNDLQRRVDQGVLPALDPKMSAGALNRLYNYFDVLPGIGEPHPVLRNERAQVLLEVLIRKRGPIQMAKVFRQYARIAAANPEGQKVMFGAGTSPMEALKQAASFGGAKSEKPPELRLVASMTARRVEPRFVLGGI